MNSMIKKLSLALVLAVVAFAGRAANWVNFSNFREVTCVTLNGNDMWVSGKGGLLLYKLTDGTQTYFKKGTNELPSLSVERVAVSPQNASIWIGTYDNGLAFLSNGQWTHVPFPDKKALLYEMKIGPDGTVWSATSAGLYEYYNGVFNLHLGYPNGAPWDIDLMPNGKILCGSNQPFILDPATDDITNINTSAFAYGSSKVLVIDGSHFVFASDHNVLSFITDTTETDTLEIGALPDDLQMRNGKLLVSYTGELFEREMYSWSTIDMGGAVSPFAVDANGTIRAANAEDGGHVLFNDMQNAAQVVSIRRSTINDNWIKIIRPDANNDLLLVGYEGIQRYHHDTHTFDVAFPTLINAPGPQDVLAVNGKYYVATPYSGLHEYTTANGWQQIGELDLPNAEVDHLTSDPQGNVWLTGPGYFAKYDGTNFTIYDQNYNSHLTNNLYTRDIHYDATRNAVWLASYEGIFKLQNGVVDFYNDSTPGIQQYYDAIEAISEDDAHNIYFGTVYGAVLKYDGTGFSTLLLPENVGNQFISDIAFDGNVMYVSDNLHGVWKYEGSTWDSLTVNNSALSSNYVTCMLKDVDGNLWIGNLSFGVDVYNKNGTSIGINEPTAAVNMLVYPNPSNGNFTIQLKDADKADIHVYNMEGRLVQQVISAPALTSMDLSANPAGVYFVKVQTAAGVSTIKMLIN